MAGLIGTGLSYEQNALSGMVRASAEQQQIDEANQNLKIQKEEQDAQADAANKQMMGTVGGMAASFLMMALF